MELIAFYCTTNDILRGIDFFEIISRIRDRAKASTNELFLRPKKLIRDEKRFFQKPQYLIQVLHYGWGLMSRDCPLPSLWFVSVLGG